MSPGDAVAHERFRRASEAHDVLSDPRLRRQYDRGMLGSLTSVADKESRKHKVNEELVP